MGQSRSTQLLSLDNPYGWGMCHDVGKSGHVIVVKEVFFLLHHHGANLINIYR